VLMAMVGVVGGEASAYLVILTWAPVQFGRCVSRVADSIRRRAQASKRTVFIR
jgi:hypothetical protein